MLIDSHCHLDRLDLTNTTLENILNNAALADVGYFLCPAVNLENHMQLLQLAETHNNIVIAVGKHPTETGHDPKIDELIELALHKKVIAIGETGLDYYYCNSEADKEYQQQLFRKHIKAAKELKKPLIIHSREAAADIIQILKDEKAKEIGGVLHCFTESLEMAEAVLELNFYISFSGIITFKNADSLRNIAKKLPLEKILIETDSPYLAPIPVRGKSNQPAYLRYIAEYLANLRSVTYEKIATQTSENFFQFSGLV